ncbi:hypothetical protein D3C71_1311000 [compost metagenome]
MRGHDPSVLRRHHRHRDRQPLRAGRCGALWHPQPGTGGRWHQRRQCRGDRRRHRARHAAGRHDAQPGRAQSAVAGRHQRRRAGTGSAVADRTRVGQLLRRCIAVHLRCSHRQIGVAAAGAGDAGHLRLWRCRCRGPHPHRYPDLERCTCAGRQHRRRRPGHRPRPAGGGCPRHRVRLRPAYPAGYRAHAGPPCAGLRRRAPQCQRPRDRQPEGQPEHLRDPG